MLPVKLVAELTDFYTILAQGGDVSPARVLHLEAKIAFLLEQESITWQAAQLQVQTLYQSSYGVPSSGMHWQWCEDDRIFRLPYRMQVAPVT